MPLRRRNIMPPYEVMGLPRRDPASPGTPPPPGVVSKAPSDQATPPPGRGWLGPSKPPVLVRVPRGMLMAASIGVLALIALAYWVGQMRGISVEAGHQQRLQQEEQSIITGARGAAQSPSTVGSTQTRTPAATGTSRTTGPGNTARLSNPTPAAGGAAAAANRTPLKRQEGLNYLILVRYPRADADRLVTYLATNGVDAAVVPSTMSGSFHVVAMRGFPAGEVGSAVANQYELQLKQLGRKWKANEKGPTDFTHSFWQKYTGD